MIAVTTEQSLKTGVASRSVSALKYSSTSTITTTTAAADTTITALLVNYVP